MEPFQDQIMGFWHTDVLPDQVGVNMTHLVDVDTTVTRDLTWATIEGRRQAHHLVKVFRQVVPGMEQCYLISTAPVLGLRESRRIKGMVTLTAEDVMNRREWPDAVCYGSFFIDIHNPAGPGMSGQTWRPPPGFYYQIPYRVMVPERVGNLLVSGRCISADHVALGSTRIMSTCMALGEAAGAAAMLLLHEDVSPRELDARLLQEQLRKQFEVRRMILADIWRLIARRQRPILVALDGGSGAGKSVLASLIAYEIDAAVVPLDDFFAADIPDAEWDARSVEERARNIFDWPRVRQDALEPLLAGRPARWYAFDFTVLRAGGTYGMCANPTIREPAPVILLDGAYSAGPQLADLVDLAVLVDAPAAVRHARLAAREEQGFLERWHARWDAVEAHYFSQVRPRASFDLVVTNG